MNAEERFEKDVETKTNYSNLIPEWFLMMLILKLSLEIFLKDLKEIKTKLIKLYLGGHRYRQNISPLNAKWHIFLTSKKGSQIDEFLK